MASPRKAKRPVPTAPIAAATTPPSGHSFGVDVPTDWVATAAARADLGQINAPDDLATDHGTAGGEIVASTADADGAIAAVVSAAHVEADDGTLVLAAKSAPIQFAAAGDLLPATRTAASFAAAPSRTVLGADANGLAATLQSAGLGGLARASSSGIPFQTPVFSPSSSQIPVVEIEAKAPLKAPSKPSTTRPAITLRRFAWLCGVAVAISMVALVAATAWRNTADSGHHRSFKAPAVTTPAAPVPSTPDPAPTNAVVAAERSSSATDGELVVAPNGAQGALSANELLGDKPSKGNTAVKRKQKRHDSEVLPD